MTNHGNRYVFGDLDVDAGRFRVERDGRPVVLEPKAFDLLILLVECQGRVVTKQEILERIWTDTAVTDNALTRVVAQLRKAIGDDARDARFIETVPTRGYRWLPAPDVAPAILVASPIIRLKWMRPRAAGGRLAAGATAPLPPSALAPPGLPQSARSWSFRGAPAPASPSRAASMVTMPGPNSSPSRRLLDAFRRCRPLSVSLLIRRTRQEPSSSTCGR